MAVQTLIKHMKTMSHVLMTIPEAEHEIKKVDRSSRVLSPFFQRILPGDYQVTPGNHPLCPETRIEWAFFDFSDGFKSRLVHFFRQHIKCCLFFSLCSFHSTSHHPPSRRLHPSTGIKHHLIFTLFILDHFDTCFTPLTILYALILT